MAGLQLHSAQEPHLLAAQLRRAFSGVVAGNVKADGVESIAAQGPFEIRGDEGIMRYMDALLSSFVRHSRINLPGTEYQPCYRLVEE